MKTVAMDQSFDYRLHPRVCVHFEAGITYLRVLEQAAREIEAAGAGRILKDSFPPNTVDARNAFKRRPR